MRDFKRAVFSLLIALELVSFAACSGESTEISEKKGNTTIVEDDKSNKNNTEDDKSANDDTKANSDNEPVKKAEAGVQKGYLFKYNDVTVSVDQIVSEVVDKLGTYTYYESNSCAFDGLDKVYTYPSFEIDGYPNGDEYCISAIIFRDDMVETEEGAYIGMEKSKIQKLYGEPTEMSGMLAIYKKDGMQLRFVYASDDTVAAIQYVSGVLQ